MNRFWIAILAFWLIGVGVLSSCSKHKKGEKDADEPEEYVVPDPEGVVRTILVYAVNMSSLSEDFVDDSKEMLQAMRKVDPDKYRLLVYYTINADECGLFAAEKQKNSDEYGFVKVKGYERDRLSTDPARIAEVIEYSLTLYPNSSYDLVFWGHGTSWSPEFTDHVPDPPMLYGYGGEYNPNSSNKDWTEIDELAAAVPDHRFESIWFDCCYMSGIETIYQFRYKCRYFVGYPTEVWQYGMAYDLMLPHMFSEQPDLPEAARVFYEYYTKKDNPVTVAVTDMSKIERIADIAKEILASGPYRPNTSALLNYSRMSKYPLYDFRQFYCETANVNGFPELADEFRAAMEELVVYHAESNKNFNYNFWNTENISGISTHYYRGTDTEQEKFYRTLDWYKRVFR